MLQLPCTCMATAAITVAVTAAAASSSRRALTAAASSSRHHAHARRRPLSSSPAAQRVRARRPPGSSGSSSNSSANGGKDDGEEVRYNFNPNPFDPTPVDAAARAGYPTVTANDLKRHTSPPRKVRMLARDFIDDSLYNPNYGYFPKQAVIFDPDAASQIESGTSTAIDRPGAHEGLDFSKFRSMSAWNEAIAETYGAIEGATDTAGAGRQVWHTPTELFKVRQISAAKFQLSPRAAILCTSNRSTSSS